MVSITTFVTLFAADLSGLNTSDGGVGSLLQKIAIVAAPFIALYGFFIIITRFHKMRGRAILEGGFWILLAGFMLDLNNISHVMEWGQSGMQAVMSTISSALGKG